MIKIGLTGGIGCGKTIVAQMLKQAGIPVISADLIAKDIVNSNNEVRNKLIKEFGDKVYRENGVMDRTIVAKIVFSDQKAREKINAIVHPYVIKQQHDELKKIEREGKNTIAGVEAALIYEAKSEYQFDYMIVVSAPFKDIIRRLKARDKLDDAEILKRIRSQMPLEEKIKRADYVIHNDSTLQALETKTKELIQWLHSKV